MTSVLVTAFEPYDRWTTNSSWLALVALTQDLPAQPTIVTRRYPVDFSVVKERLARDLEANYDVALHLGQAPGTAHVRLEAIGVNVGGAAGQTPEQFRPLVDGGPVAYRSTLPLARWAGLLRESNIPAQVSYHAGTYLCNAALYLSCHLSERMGLRTQSAFVHLPLDLSQTIDQSESFAALPTATAAQALRLILEDLALGLD